MNNQQSIQEFVSSLIDGNLSQESQSFLMSGIGGKNDSIPKNKKKSKTESKLPDLTVEVINYRRQDCSGRNERCVNIGGCGGSNNICKNTYHDGGQNLMIL